MECEKRESKGRARGSPCISSLIGYHVVKNSTTKRGLPIHHLYRPDTSKNTTHAPLCYS